MSQSKLPKHKHDAYNHRDVASLPPPFTQWSGSFEMIQRAHNRILQPGFMHRDVDDVLADAKTAGVEWLTNICCPSAKADIMLHISKEMVVNYQVADKEFNVKAHAVYASLVEDIEDQILESIDIRVDDEMELFKRENAEQIEQAARKMLIDNFKNKDNGPDQEKGLKDEDITLEQLDAAKRVVSIWNVENTWILLYPKWSKSTLLTKRAHLD